MSVRKTDLELEQSDPYGASWAVNLKTYGTTHQLAQSIFFSE